MTNKTFNPDRLVGHETHKSYQYLIESGFMQKYFSGDNIIEVGYAGRGGCVPITENAIGIDNDYPGYDGLHLPFPNQSQDTVYSSHCLEHIPDSRAALADWFRVIKQGGHLIIAVPHQQLYEKKMALPSTYAPYDHVKFYMPGILLKEIEEALPFGEWRLRGIYDNDMGFDYSLTAYQHSVGCYEIVAIVQRIHKYPYIDQMLNRY